MFLNWLNSFQQLLQAAGSHQVLEGAHHPVLDLRRRRLRPPQRGRGPGGGVGRVRAREAGGEDGHVPRGPAQGRDVV